MAMLKVTVTVEYEANPLYYEAEEAVKMAEIDQKLFNEDIHALLDILEGGNCNITVEPV